jgi:hypothetical protein
MYHPINNYKLPKLMLLQSFMRPVMLVSGSSSCRNQAITSTIYEFFGDVVVLFAFLSLVLTTAGREAVFLYVETGKSIPLKERMLLQYHLSSALVWNFWTGRYVIMS